MRKVNEEKIAYYLNYRDVLELLNIIDNYHYEEFHLEMGDLKLKVNKGKSTSAGLNDSASTLSTNITNAQPAPIKADDVVKNAADEMPPVVTAATVNEATSGTAIKSPIMGVFYKTPAPDAEPFVKVGSQVKQGDQVGIIEVMKVMNALKAPCDGVISEILTENEQMVEIDQVIMLIEPQEVGGKTGGEVSVAS